MPVKPNKAPQALALLIIMLVLRSTMGMATAELLPEDALRTFQASKTLHADLTPPASRQKRYLRSTADMMTTSSGEVRKLTFSLEQPLFSQIPREQELAFSARLRQRFSTTLSKINAKIWLWTNKHKTPEQAFKSLRLNKKGENPFQNQRFSTWKDFVEKTTPKKEDVTKVMYETMVPALGGEVNLVKILVQAKSSHGFGETVQSLRDYQIEQWVQRGFTSGNAFDFLELKNDKKLPGLPGFSMWAVFNIKKGSVKEAFELIKKPRAKTVDSDLMEALAKIPAADENFNFAQGLLYSQLQYLSTKPESIGSLYRVITIHERKASDLADDLAENPLRKLWVDYVYMNAQGQDGLTHFEKVYKMLKDWIDHSAAVHEMKMVDTDGHFLKMLEKEDHIKDMEKKNFDSFMKNLQEKEAKNAN